MASMIMKTLLWPVPRIFSDETAIAVVRRLSQKLPKLFKKLPKLSKELEGEATDILIELLLRGMDFMFLISPKFRRNLFSYSPDEWVRSNSPSPSQDFQGRYMFCTKKGRVVASATFGNGNMEVSDNAIPNWTALVTFEDPTALRSFIFSENQDILDSLLKDEVEVDGNLNHIYKFGFMARELKKLLGIGK